MNCEVDFSTRILEWYTINKRELPWRMTNSPYAIWLSEIILQQTRVVQGISYYNKFMAQFPTVFELAKADEDLVLKLWQGLGYYSRARNMHKAARIITEDLQGHFPNNAESLQKLPGVGEYTAAAIASIAFQEPKAVVDGNVYRVLSRVFGIFTPIDSTAGRNEFLLLAQKLIPKEQPGDYNQAIMEFGATWCTPKNPKCKICSFEGCCYAHKKSNFDKLPVKIGKQKIRIRYFNYLVLIKNNSTYLSKRTDNDIWKNLFEFPLIETDLKTDIQKLAEYSDKYAKILSGKVFQISKWLKHVLSHQHIYYRFIYIDISEEKNKLPDLINVNKKNIFDFAVPRLIDMELNNLIKNRMFI